MVCLTSSRPFRGASSLDATAPDTHRAPGLPRVVGVNGGREKQPSDLPRESHQGRQDSGAGRAPGYPGSLHSEDDGPDGRSSSRLSSGSMSRGRGHRDGARDKRGEYGATRTSLKSLVPSQASRAEKKGAPTASPRRKTKDRRCWGEPGSLPSGHSTYAWPLELSSRQ